MNIKQYFTSQYLFQVNPTFIDSKEKLVFFSGLILVLLCVVLKISAVLAPSPVDRKYRSKFYRMFLTIGISQLLWYLCRYENVGFFGTHFVSLFIALIGLVWFVLILVSTFKNYSKEKLAWDKEQVKLKYLSR